MGLGSSVYVNGKFNSAVAIIGIDTILIYPYNLQYNISFLFPPRIPTAPQQLTKQQFNQYDRPSIIIYTNRQTTTHLHAAKKIIAREKPKVSSKPLSSYLQDTDDDDTNDNHINNENENINQQIEINIESTDNSNNNIDDIDYDQHHNYPKVILQADKLGRSVQSQLLRILPNNQEQKLVSSTPEWKKLQRQRSSNVIEWLTREE